MKKTFKFVFIAILGLLIGVAAYFIFTLIPTSVKVIDFTNLTQNEVIEWANKNNVSNKIVFVYEFSNDVDENNVISQSLNEGDKLSDTITIVISKGKDKDASIALPDITDMSKNELVTYLEKEGFTNFEFDYSYSTKYANNTVLSIDPSDEATLNDTIYIYISVTDYKNIESIIVPDFSKYSLDDIENWKTNHNANVTYEYRNDSTKANNAVITQSITALTQVSANAEIKITICKKENDLITVEDKAGKVTEAEFKEYITGLGLVPKLTSGYFSTTITKGYVYWHEDGEFEKGDTIGYALSVGPYVFDSSDYLRKSQTTINTLVKQYNSSNAHITVKFTTVETNEYDDGVCFEATAEKDEINTIITCKIAKEKTTAADDEVLIDETEYLNMSETDFLTKLNELGLGGLKVSEYYSTTIESGNIYSYEDGFFKKGSDITYSISLGSYTLNESDYIGYSEEDIDTYVARINKQNAHVVVTFKFPDEVDHSECKASGVTATKNGLYTYIECTMSKPSEESSDEEKVTIDDSMVNKTENEFIKYLNDLNLVGNKTTELYSSTINEGNVIQYTAGSYAKGATINYSVSLGSYEFDASQFLNKTNAEVNTLVTSLNKKNANIVINIQTVETNDYTENLVYSATSNNDGTKTNITCLIAKKKEETTATTVVVMSPSALNSSMAKNTFEDTKAELLTYFKGIGFAESNLTFLSEKGTITAGKINYIKINGTVIVSTTKNVPLDAKIIISISSGMD